LSHKSTKNVLETKEKFLNFVKERNPDVKPWISKLIDEFEKRNTELELVWSVPLPNKDFPISAQVWVRKWRVNPFEILCDDFFAYLVEPRFHFDNWGEAGGKPLWELPNGLENELCKVLKDKARGGGIMVNLDSKLKFNRVVKAVDLVIQCSNKSEIIWNEKVKQ